MKFFRSRKISLALIWLIFITVSGCAKKEVTPAAAPREASEKSKEGMSTEELLQVRQEVYSFKVEGFDRDKKIQWGLEGESANVTNDKININSLKGVYYGGDITLILFADRAIYDKKTQDIELMDNIVGKTSDGSELITDYAKWNAKSEEITTDSYIVVKRENISCKGRGVVTKPRLKYAVFQNEIEVNIAPDKKITCDGPFELDHEKNVAIFNNNVKIIDTVSETITDKLTVYLDPETNQILRVITEGNVRVVHRGEVEDLGKLTF